MKNILVIDACVRRDESRTKKMMDRAVETLKGLHKDCDFEVLNLLDLDLNYLNTETLKKRDELLAQKRYDHPMFVLGKQFREADGIIVAAPFWDLSVPAVLKVYIENVSLEGITFGCDASGLHGLCRGKWMLFLTTRGDCWEGSPMEQGSTYMKAISRFFGIDSFQCVSADGLDNQKYDGEKILQDALRETEDVCKILF